MLCVVWPRPHWMYRMYVMSVSLPRSRLKVAYENLFDTDAVQTAASEDGGGGEFEAGGLIKVATALAILAKDRPFEKIIDLGAGRGWLLAIMGAVSVGGLWH